MSCIHPKCVRINGVCHCTDCCCDSCRVRLGHATQEKIVMQKHISVEYKNNHQQSPSYTYCVFDLRTYLVNSQCLDSQCSNNGPLLYYFGKN